MEWIELFKQSPVGAILGVAVTAVLWWWQNMREKNIDNKEVERLTAALIEERKEKQEAVERADDAIAKQIEMVERFSEMRAQNERMLERMSQMTDKLDELMRENEQLRQEVHALRGELKNLTTVGT